MSWALVPAEGVTLSAPLTLVEAVRQLPVGSLVEAGGPCPGGVRVEVLSVAGWIHPEPAAKAGDRGCLPAVRPLADEVAVMLTDGAVPAGTRLTQAQVRALSTSDLARVRFVAPALLAEVEATQAVYTARFGPIGLEKIPWNDWGRIGLPLTPIDVAAEIARERLTTPAQREKAVVSEGPAYTHFLGSDAPGSDTWGSPGTIRALLTLAADWSAYCAPNAGCDLQIGDIAYYNDTRPDPLGHKDHRGDCVDLRLFRTDGSRYEAWWDRPDDRTGVAAYDGARTLDFLRFAYEHAAVGDVYFNDPAVRAALPTVKPSVGHDDHVHLCLAERDKNPG